MRRWRDTVNEILKNSACPTDMTRVKAAAQALLPMLHPELFPGAIENDPAKEWSFTHPGEEHEQRMKTDPSYRQHMAEALRTIQFGVPVEIRD
jgi:hypothetical protein